MNFRVESDARDGMLFLDGYANKVYVGVDGAVAAADARLKILQYDSSGQMCVLHLDQQDVDDVFIKFVGTSAADQSKSISTLQGTGAIIAPLGSTDAQNPGWKFYGMIKCEIGSTEVWLCAYQVDAV